MTNPVLSARDLIGSHPQIVGVRKQIAKAAASREPVRITGETGTGKEVVARAIHAGSSRRSEPFIAVNCAAIPPELAESELFGHRKGSFTGATAEQIGQFEVAGEGTIFLDEIGDMRFDLQPKLLRFLQTGEFRPVGGDRPKYSRARVIAATHQPLPQLVAEGRFREDLFHRLDVFRIVLPPLRERRPDIPVLAMHLLHRLARDANVRVADFTPEQLRCLQEQYWRGNVRQLETGIRRAIANGDWEDGEGGRIVISFEDVLDGADGENGGESALANLLTAPEAGNPWLTVDELVVQYVALAMRHLGTYTAAAEALDVNRDTVAKYCAKHREKK